MLRAPSYQHWRACMPSSLRQVTQIVFEQSLPWGNADLMFTAQNCLRTLHYSWSCGCRQRMRPQCCWDDHSASSIPCSWWLGRWSIQLLVCHLQIPPFLLRPSNPDISIHPFKTKLTSNSKPVAKWPTDREALIKAVVSGTGKFFFGSDSAPQ